MNTKNLSTLNIHKLTRAQYNRELAAGRIDEDALYLVPDTDMTDSEILARLDDKADKATLASSTVNGLMAKEDKIKLNSISGYYGVCSGQGASRTKKVDCSNFKLENGATIFIYFDDNQRCAEEVKLNINNTGGIEIVSHGNNVDINNWWSAGEIVGFTYNGTNYVMHKGAPATTTYYGITKLTSTIDNSEALAATPKMVNTVNTALNNHIASVGSAEDASHVKLSDAIDNTDLTADSGATAATPAAVAAVNEKTKVVYIALSELATQEGYNKARDAFLSGLNVALKYQTSGDADDFFLIPLVGYNEIDGVLTYLFNVGTSGMGITVNNLLEVHTEEFTGVLVGDFEELQAQLNNHIATTGDNENQGHLKLSDAIDSNSSVKNGIAATPKAVKEALEKAKEVAVEEAGEATSTANRYTDDKITDLIGPVLSGNETLSGLETYISNSINSLTSSVDTKLANYVKNNEDGTITGDLSVSGSITSSFIGDLEGTADSAKIAEALNSKNIGDTNNPVYFDKDGKPAIASGIVKSLSDLSAEVNNQAALIEAKAEAKTLTDHIGDKTHITDTERTSWNSAEQNAKDYAGELDSTIRGGSTTTLKALEDSLAATDKKAQDNAAAFSNYTTTADLNTTLGSYATKGYADQAETDAIKSANEYTDGKIALIMENTSTETLDSIKELATAIKDNDGAIAALDAIAAERVAKAGDTMTGNLVFDHKDNVYAGIKWSSVNGLNPFIGYATDKTNGTFVLGAVEGTKAASGLSIDGGTKALQWKGTTLATAADLTALVGGAATDYNTLGKLETKIKAVDTKVNNTNNAFSGYYTKDELKKVITGVASSSVAESLLSFTHIDGSKTKLTSVYASHTKAIAQDADMYLFGSIEPASYKQNRYNTNVKVSLSDNKLHAPNLNISNTANIGTLAVSTKATVQGTLDVAGGLTKLGNGLKVDTASGETITFTDIATFKKETTASGASSMSSFKGDVMIGEGVTLHYNTTDKALEFVFA